MRKGSESARDTIKEALFKQEQSDRQKRGLAYKSRTIVLQCIDCGTTVTRRAVALYTGHMYEQQVTYVCPDCRGDMKLMIDKDGDKDND